MAKPKRVVGEVFILEEARQVSLVFTWAEKSPHDTKHRRIARPLLYNRQPRPPRAHFQGHQGLILPL